MEEKKHFPIPKHEWNEGYHECAYNVKGKHYLLPSAEIAVIWEKIDKKWNGGR
uniref:hypothetical protein n=1 Tax=Prevotella sp. TaxID=59823 RepID=UPI004027D623